MNRVKKNEIEMHPDAVKEMLEIPILGMVPEDICVQQSLKLKDAVIHTHPKSMSSRAYKEIAAKILNIEYDSDSDKERVIERILRRLGFR